MRLNRAATRTLDSTRTIRRARWPSCSRGRHFLDLDEKFAAIKQADYLLGISFASTGFNAARVSRQVPN
jgi:hypothetical protein